MAIRVLPVCAQGGALLRADAPHTSMRPTPRRMRLLWIILATIGAALLASIPSLRAQTMDEPVVKAAFLYNFARFAEWPADRLANGQRLSLCVVGDNAVAAALEKTVRGHSINGHDLIVQVAQPDGPIRACHLLYASGLGTPLAARLLESIDGAGVLSVSDDDHFAQMGGVAQFVNENSRLRFIVNISASQRARISVSSKLLSLATIIKDDRHAGR